MRAIYSDKMRKKHVENYDYVKSVFLKYLDDNKKRRTLERLAILEQVCSINGCFDMETLSNKVKRAKFRVSQPTLYNTLNLLIECGFVVRHIFDHNETTYEFVFGKHKLVTAFMNVDDIYKAIDISDERLGRIIRDVEKKYSVKIKSCNLTFHCENVSEKVMIK